MRYVVIIAGGSGTRLWPLSRQGMPKQLLDLISGTSLLRMAYDRVAGLVPADRILVCTGAAYADRVAAQIPELLPENLLGEPVGRDSLNAMAWPAAILADRDPDAVVAMVSADQVIEPVTAFRAAVVQAFEVAEQRPDTLVTFGVVPDVPHTGYGYLHRGEEIPDHDGVCRVLAFKEKPDPLTARHYLDSGDYWWNSGMFVWRADVLLDQVRRLVPDAHRIATELARSPEKLAGLYPSLPRISVDFAIMEPVSQGRGSATIVAVPLPISWHDVGGFPALADQLPRDAEGNAIDGRAVVLDGRDTLVINRAGTDHLVATLGCEDLIVVATPDVTLVCSRDHAERIKTLVAEVAAREGDHYT